ncbi:hypothetical protein [Actinokineospora enzanensis]|uniref:hypothetical protein n=1 Tax=Actinokineospora enzanensis TaxID=155975 RepID=UPI00035E7B63|nr:hypothetical protein [Actinokineospora enzanensis]
MLLLLVLVFAGLAIAALVYADSDRESASTPAPTGSPPVSGLEWGEVTWYWVHGAQVPVSRTHGPRENGDLARGFAHTPQGAVLAAVHISTRTSGMAGGEEVFGPTIRTQTTGDVERYYTAIAGNYQELRGGGAAPLIIGYRLDPGSTADDVRLSILARVANPTNPSLTALITGPLHVRWVGDDWKLVVPTGAGEQVKEIPPGFSAMPGQRLANR